MNFKYLFGAFISIPLLPVMYFQGKKIRNSVPELPEAKGTDGECIINSSSEKFLNVIAIGESTIAGVGVNTHKEGFTGAFAEEVATLLNTNVRWKVYAKSGYTTYKVHKKIIPKITDKYADIVVIGLGGNDAFTLNSPRKWNLHITSLINAVNNKFPNAVIIFCNMPPIKEFPAFTPLIKFTIGNLVEILGSELRNNINKYDNVFYFDEKITLNKWIEKFNLKLNKEDFFSDGVHPSKITYQTWAKELANESLDFIKQSLKI